MAESLIVTAPATSANLGPGFDVLAAALDFTNAVVITRRPGPLAVRVIGEGAGELPEDESNLICRSLAEGLDSLDGLEIECRNRIPLGRGLGSSAASVCAGLIAANAIGGLRWSPSEILERATRLEGHADNAAACLTGGIIAVGVEHSTIRLEVPRALAFLAAIPLETVSTHEARAALPGAIPIRDAVTTLANGIRLVLALNLGHLEDLPAILDDRLHEPYRGTMVPGLDQMRALVGTHGCLGVTISGSGPTTLLWCREESFDDLEAAATDALAAAGSATQLVPMRIAQTGVRARWATPGDAPRLERSIG
jgi:homoserine kinase